MPFFLDNKEQAEWTAAAIAVQRITRGKLYRLSWSRGEKKKAWAAMTLKVKLGAVVAKRMFRNRLRRRRAEHGKTNNLELAHENTGGRDPPPPPPFT